MTEKQPVGRLAFRVEGDKWTCYLAKPNTMEGARWMGSILMGIAREPERKELFMEVMRKAFAEALEQYFGEGSVESWTTETAPQSERSGSA